MLRDKLSQEKINTAIEVLKLMLSEDWHLYSEKEREMFQLIIHRLYSIVEANILNEIMEKDKKSPLTNN